MSEALNIVDSHVHLWDPARLRYTWLDGLPALNRAFLPEDVAAASMPLTVSKMILVEGGCDPGQSLAEVDWFCGLAQHDPRIAGVVAHAPLEQGAAARDYLQQLAQRPLVKGVRRLLQGESEADFCLRPEFIEGVKLLAGLGFTFDVCIRHEQLPAVTELVRRVPEVGFVLDHFGKPPVKAGQLQPWAAQLADLATLPNVSCKVSGLSTEADWESWSSAQLRPFVETALEAFGYDRVLFGGDWPVSTLATTYTRWVDTVQELTAGASAADRNKLFQHNALTIYHL